MPQTLSQPPYDAPVDLLICYRTGGSRRERTAFAIRWNELCGEERVTRDIRSLTAWQEKVLLREKDFGYLDTNTRATRRNRKKK
jgi:hypothetical protein